MRRCKVTDSYYCSIRCAIDDLATWQPTTGNPVSHRQPPQNFPSFSRTYVATGNLASGNLFFGLTLAKLCNRPTLSRRSPGRTHGLGPSRVWRGTWPVSRRVAFSPPCQLILGKSGNCADRILGLQSGSSHRDNLLNRNNFGLVSEQSTIWPVEPDLQTNHTSHKQTSGKLPKFDP